MKNGKPTSRDNTIEKIKNMEQEMTKTFQKYVLEYGTKNKYQIMTIRGGERLGNSQVVYHCVSYTTVTRNINY